MTPSFRPYAARPINALSPVERRGFTLKRYWIDLQAEPAPDAADWAGAIALAVQALPQEDDPGRAGVGFLILHRGRGADYLVLGWWARENELPLRVIVRYPGTDDAQWRPARDDESVCVWDLEVIAFERDAYVASFLAGQSLSAARDAYLAAHL
jgi:hypothetical protein